MSEFLPQAVREELALARKAARRRKAQHSVHVGDEAFPILEFSETGFAVDTATTQALRGLVDIYAGSRHLFQALIITAAEDGDVMRYEFKRNTAAKTTAPLDFVASDGAATVYLPKQ